jgi:hypothetical protein
MKRARVPLWLLLALWAIGCAESEPSRVASASPPSGVILSNRDPGSCCRALGNVEVQSDREDEAATDTLRDTAVARGANFIVLDGFGVYDERVLARARLFRCPELAQQAGL